MDLLPGAISDLAQRLGSPSGTAPNQVVLTQQGRLRSAADAKWMSFRAKQIIQTRSCALDWRAAAGPLHAVRINDVLDEAGGRLGANLFGILPLAKASGPEVTRGELMRYLAELAWCPDAIRHNTAVEWEVRDPRHFNARSTLRQVSASIDIELDSRGRIAAICAPDRPRNVGQSFVETPWWGRFADHREVEGRLIPHRAEVGWNINGGSVTVWEGQITGWATTG